MRIYKRVISLVIAMTMVLGMFPASVFDATSNGIVQTENITDFAGGVGTEYDPYIIATKEHLNNVRKYPDAYYIMAKDIEFTDFDFSISGQFYNDGEGWQPIENESGNDATSFTGYFDGNGHTIKNLQSSVGGLFASLSNATVKNLGLIDGELAYGSIAGSASNCTIECCYNTCIITGDNAGGLIYRISGTTLIYNCYNVGIVQAEDAAGGIILSGSDTATVEKCYNEGSVTAVNRAGGISATGGNLVACANYGDVSASGSDNIKVGGISGRGATISYCYNEGSVTCSINNSRVPSYLDLGMGSFDTTGCRHNSIGSAGGISGYDANIENSYNAGDVVCNVTTTGGGNRACSFAGGIVGSYLPSKTISNCYNTGNITANANNTATIGAFAVFSAHAYCGGIYGATGFLSEYRSTAFAGHNVITNNCYNIGTTVACSTTALGEEYEYEYDGGVVGLTSSSATFNNVYFDASIDNEVGSGSYSGNITSSTASQMRNESTYSGFDFIDLWTMAGKANFAYPEIQYIAYEFDKNRIGVCDSVEVDIEDYLFFYYSQDYIEPGDTVQIGADYGEGEYGGMYYDGEVKWEISNPNVLEVIETINNVTTITVKALNVGECKLTLYLDGVACRTETIFVNITDDTMINEYMNYLLDCSTLTTLKAARDSGWEIVNNFSEGDKAKIAFITCLKNDLGLGIITQEIEAALGMTTGMAESAVDEVIDALMVEIFSADTSFGDKVGNFKSKYKNVTTTTKALQFGQEDAVIEALATYTSFDSISLKNVLNLYKGYTSNTIDALELLSATALTAQYERDVVVALMNSVAMTQNGAGTDLYKGLDRLLSEIDNIDTYAEEKFINDFVVGELNGLIQKGLFKVTGLDKGTFGMMSTFGKLIAQMHKNEGGIFADDYMKACIGLGFAGTMYNSLVNSYDTASLETSFNFYIAAVKVGLSAAIDIAGDDYYSTVLKNTAKGYLNQVNTTCSYDVYIRQCRNEMNNAMELKLLNSVVNDKMVGHAYWILPEETQTASISTYMMDDYDFYEWNFEEDKLLDIPTIIDGIEVTGIADYGFSGISSIYGVIIPDSVENIGQYAFSNCSNLYFATLGSNLKHIESGAFYNCFNMQTINMPNCVETIGENSFYGCSKLEMISLPETTKIISQNAFNGCILLKNIVIKNENAIIEDDAFVNCADGLTIYGYSGGTVELYALENNIQFVSLERLIASLKIETPASKTTYCVGDDIVTEGLSLNVTYTDGVNEIINSGWIVTGNTTREGTNEVMVYYGDEIIMYDIQVEKNDSQNVNILTSKDVMFFGESIQLELDADYVAPVNWETSDNEVITVENGYITACGLGKAIISVSSNGVILDSITLNVVNTKQIDPSEVMEDYITFTAPKTGKYVFFSENSTHIISGSVYDLYGVKLFGNSGINFRVECVLEEGESYSLHTLCGNETNSIDVSIDFVGIPVSMIISDSNGYETEYIYGDEGDSKYLYTQFLPRSSKIETVTWYSEDSDIASVDENGYVSLNGKGKTYVHATGSSGVTDSVLVIVNESYTNLGEQMKLNEEYILYSSISKTSTFVPDSTGFYKVYIKQSDANEYPDIYDNVTISVTPDAYHSGYYFDYSEDGNYICEYNTVYYFESGKEYSVTVTSNGVLPTKLMLSKVPDPTSVSLSATEISFKEDDYGRSLYVTLSPEYTYGHYTWESSDETVAIVSSSGYVKPVGGGEATITVSVNGTELSASCNVSVEGDEIRELNIGEEYSDLPEDVYFIQPSKSGYYKIVFNGCSGDLSDSNNKGLGYINSSYNMICEYLEAGKKYIFEINPNYGDGAYGSIQECVAPIGISLDKEIKLTPDTNKTLYVTSQNDGSYFDDTSATFTIADSEIAKITHTNSRGNSYSYESYFTIQGLKIGQTTLTITTKDGAIYTFPVVIEDYAYIYDSSKFELSLAQDESEIYRFVPEESASFTLEASGTQGCSIYVRDESNKYLTGVGENYWGEGHYVSVSYEFEKGKTYFVEIEGDFLYSGNFVFELNKTVEANELVLSVNKISGFVDESFALSYELLPTYSFPETVSWQSSDDTIATVDESGNVVLVSEGFATITVTSTNGIAATCVVEVKTVPTISCDEEKQLTTEVDSGIGLYRFVPEEDGIYCFYSYNNDFDTYGYILDAEMNEITRDDDSGEGSNFSIQYGLNAGQTYYLKSKPYSTSSVGIYSIKVVHLVPASSISMNVGDSYSAFVGTNISLSVEFAPQNSLTEEIAWVSSDPSVATVDEDGYVSLLKIGTTTITATSDNGLTTTCTITVEDYPTITEDEEVTVVLKQYDPYAYFYFTPDEDGYYVFYSKSNNDTYGYILDTDLNQLNSDDDSGEDTNFRVAYQMEAGTTYVLKAKFYNTSTNGSFNVIIEKSKYISNLEITSLPIKMEYVKGFTSNNLDYSGLKLKATWSDGTTTNWEIYVDDFYIGDQRVYINNSNIDEDGIIRIVCGGKEVTYTLTLIDNPVDYLEVVNGTSYSYIEHYNGYFDENNNGEYFYYYTNYPSDAEIKIVYIDGSSVITKPGQYVDGYSVSWSHDQYNNPWKVGADNQSTVSYLGHNVNLPIIVEENKVANIEVVSEKVTCVENCDYYSPNFVGAEITITYIDGSSEVVVLTDDNIVYDYYPWSKNLVCKAEIDGHILSIEPYQGDEMFYVAYYLGSSCEIRNMTFVESKEIKSVDLDNVSWNGDGMNVKVTYTDETTDSITIDIATFYDLEDSRVVGFGKTEKGLLYYGIETYTDEDGRVEKYMVNVFGKDISVETENIMVGDVNADGSINNKDVTLLRRYLIGGWNVEIDLVAADVNNDGSVNNKDVTLLRRYLIGGWDVSIG